MKDKKYPGGGNTDDVITYVTSDDTLCYQAKMTEVVYRGRNKS